MAKKMKIRAKSREGICNLRLIIKHPMEPGLRRDKKTGKKAPAHYIERVEIANNNELLTTAYWSGAVSKNPFLQLELKEVFPKDELKVTWFDNQGQTQSQTEIVR